MAGGTDIITILSQSHAAKEIYNARKQDIESQRHQTAHELKKKDSEDKVKVSTYDTGNKIYVNGEDGRKGNQDSEKPSQQTIEQEFDETPGIPERGRIDITI